MSGLLTASAWAAILAHCQAERPIEACGMVLVDERGEQNVRPVTNIAGRCHAQNPTRFPRPAEESFIMDPVELARIEVLRRRGWRVHVIYHAHTQREGAVFSQDDRNGALLPSGITPAHPEAHHVVVSLDRFGPTEACAYRWDGRRFRCVAAANFARSTGAVLRQDPGHELIAVEVPV